MPRIEKVIVQVFKQGDSQKEINLQDVKVELVSTYRNTAAQQQLNSFLQLEKEEKL